MPAEGPLLHLLCGKIAAGKTTLARRLASVPTTILVSEDVWLEALYPGEITALEDYIRCTSRLRRVIGPHIEALLQAGLSVVMDIPANTIATRQWLRGIADGAGVGHQLHWLDRPDAVCKERLARRNQEGTHAFAPTEADYDLVARYFVPPSPQEDLVVVVHAAD